MAPSLRRKCHGRNSKIELKEATTQTEVTLLNRLQPNVVLEKLQIEKNSSKINEAPGSYTVFVNPITNNEDANSTLLLLENKRKFIKPGPLCYKKRVLERLNDLEVPIALGNRSLTTIVEQDSAGTPPPDFSLDSGSRVSTRENFTQVNDECLGEEPRNVRLEFEGITTVISARNEEIHEEGKSEEGQDDEGWKNAKYIKITANTVHIHNHFYKA